MRTIFTTSSWQRTLYIMLFVQFVSSMAYSIIFPFLSFYVQHLGTNTNLSLEFWVGMVFAVQGMTMMFASPLWGAVADRYGRKLMVVRAAFGGGLLVLLMGFARSAEELVVLRAIQGLVSGTVPAVSAMVAAAAPRERAGYAMGVLQLGLWSGVAVGPLVGGFMADTWGFRSAFIATTVLLVIAGTLVWLGVQEVFEPKAKTRRSGAFIGEWRSILAAPGVGLIYGTRSLSWLARTMLTPIIPLFAASLLPETAKVSTFTGLVVGVAAAAGTFSAVYLGRLGDHIGHRKVLVGSAIAGASFYILQLFVAEAWQFLLVHALAGAALGGIMPALSALLNRYTQPGQEGAVYGLDSSVAAAARSVAPLAGTSVAVWLGLPGTFAIAGAILLFSAAMALRWLPDAKAVPGSEFGVPGSEFGVRNPEPRTLNPEPGTRNPRTRYYLRIKGR